jgi:hypothetical protein
MMRTDVFLHKVLKLRHCEEILILLDCVGTSNVIVAYESKADAEDRLAEEDLLSNGSHNKFFLINNSVSISVE